MFKCLKLRKLEIGIWNLEFGEIEKLEIGNWKLDLVDFALEHKEFNQLKLRKLDNEK
jgi:hypothetical protein